MSDFTEKHKGYKWFHVESGLSLSKSKLGLFMYHLIKINGEVGDIFCLNSQYDRSFIGMSVCIDPSKREELEQLTKVKLSKPPTVVLN